jgi:hypothetical protein
VVDPPKVALGVAPLFPSLNPTLGGSGVWGRGSGSPADGLGGQGAPVECPGSGAGGGVGALGLPPPPSSPPSLPPGWPAGPLNAPKVQNRTAGPLTFMTELQGTQSHVG